MEYISSIKNFICALLALALVVAAVGAVATPVAAQSDQPDWAVGLFDRMGPMVEEYNESVNVEHFGVMASQLRAENVNLVVDDPANGTEASVSFTLDDNLRMQELALGTRYDATIRMNTDKATIDRIIASNYPAYQFRAAVIEGDITISGIGRVSHVKWTVINIAAVVFRRIFG